MLPDVVTALLQEPVYDGFRILRQALEISDLQPNPARMHAPEPVDELAKRRRQAELFENRRAQGGDQTPHLQNRALRKIPRVTQFGFPLASAIREILLQHFHLQAD